jgi:hypothetical protein
MRGMNYDCRHGNRSVGRSDTGLVMKRHIIQSLCLSLLLVPTAVANDYRDEIGYKSLEDEGRLISRGANISVGQVEAPIDQAYNPDRGASQFLGKHFIPPGNYNPSGHATMVGGMFYGKDGIAPAVQNITIFDSTGFLIGKGPNHAGAILKVGQRGEPRKLNVSVLNNSWIASFTSDAQNIEAIRRLDWVIERDDVVVVSSVDNGAGSPFPKLLATAYNGIAAGIDFGEGSSGGPITFDSHGSRTKPDLVVPVATTSEAAGAVSGAAALIRSEAKARHLNVSELTTKAILMAGAERPDDWQRGGSGTFDDEKMPLDYRYGAGSLRVDNSFDILVGGQHSSGQTSTGWDTSIAKKKNHIYQFNIAADDGESDDEVDAFTAVLTWNRDVKRSPRGTFSSSMADLEMSLLKKNGTRWNRVTRSDSDYDNVESITLNELAPGGYRLVVRGDKPEPYSVAWFTSRDAHRHGGGDNSGPGGGGDDEPQMLSMLSGPIAPTAVPEPTVFALLLPAAGLLAARRQKKPR